MSEIFPPDVPSFSFFLMKTKHVITLITAKKVLFKDVYGNKVILVLKKFCGKKSLRLYFPGIFSGCNHRKRNLILKTPLNKFNMQMNRRKVRFMKMSKT